jgi:hypothetical protein
MCLKSISRLLCCLPLLCISLLVTNLKANATVVSYVWSGKCYEGCIGKQTFTLDLPQPYSPWNIVISDFWEDPYFTFPPAIDDYFPDLPDGSLKGYRSGASFPSFTHDSNHIEYTSYLGYADFYSMDDGSELQVDTNWSSRLTISKSGWLTGMVLREALQPQFSECPPTLCFSEEFPRLLLRGRFKGDLTPIPLPAPIELFVVAIAALFFLVNAKSRRLNSKGAC